MVQVKNDVNTFVLRECYTLSNFAKYNGISQECMEDQKCTGKSMAFKLSMVDKEEIQKRY